MLTLSSYLLSRTMLNVTEDRKCQSRKGIEQTHGFNFTLRSRQSTNLPDNNLRTSSNTSRANQDILQESTRGTEYDKQRLVNVAGARANVGTTEVQNSGFSVLIASNMGSIKNVPETKNETTIGKDDTDDEVLKNKEIGSHINVHGTTSIVVLQNHLTNILGPKIFDDEPMNQGDTNITIDSSDICYDRAPSDQMKLILLIKNELCAHQETISIMSQAKEAQIKLYKTREDKELDKVIALENKVKVLNDIVYKTGQSVQTMNMLNRNCKTSFAKPEFLKKAQRMNPRLYDIGCYNDNLALMLAPDSDEMIRLDKERRSKLSDLIRPFDYDQLNNLYDLFVPQREKLAEQHYFPKTSKMSHTSSNKEFSKESFRKQTTLLEKRIDESIPWDQKCKSSKELFKIKRVLTRFLT
ncbi:hypothetical protein Tco_0701447 [Tanacetum coccineum]